MGYGINAARKITDTEYTSNWNSTTITTTGDPLQRSILPTAVFLQNNEYNR